MSSLSTPKNAEPTTFDTEVLSSKLQLCMLHGNASTSPKFMKHVNFSNQRNTCDSAQRQRDGERTLVFAQPFSMPSRSGPQSAAARRRAQRMRRQRDSSARRKETTPSPGALDVTDERMRMYLRREETEESRLDNEVWVGRRRIETEENKVSGKKESRGGAFRSASGANSRLPRAPDSFNSRFSEFREVIAQEEKQNKRDTESPPGEIEEEDLVASEASPGRGSYRLADLSADGHSEVLDETEGLGSRALGARRALETSPASGTEGTLQKMMRLRQVLELDLFDSSREELKDEPVQFSNKKKSTRSN